MQVYLAGRVDREGLAKEPRHFARLRHEMSGPELCMHRAQGKHVPSPAGLVKSRREGEEGEKGKGRKEGKAERGKTTALDQRVVRGIGGKESC